MSNDMVLSSFEKAVAAYVRKDKRRYDLARQPPEIVIVPASMRSNLAHILQ